MYIVFEILVQILVATLVPNFINIITCYEQNQEVYQHRTQRRQLH